MKNIILTATLFFSFTYSANAKAKIPVCIPCEYIETTLDLSDETEFIGDDEDPLNLGYRYKQINILWIPIWNYEGQYCLVNDAEDTYYEISEEEKAFLSENYDANFEGSPLSLWNKIGGKAIILIVLGISIYGYLPSKKKDDESGVVEDSE